MKNPKAQISKANTDAKPRNLREQAYQEIKDAIYTGKLHPGDQLAEETLSHALSISRTPIHAALQQLVYNRLAESDSTGHVYVSRLTDEDVHDMTVMRLALEPLAIEEAPLPINADVLDRLRLILEEQEQTAAAEPLDLIRFSELDSQFHIELSHICSNHLLQDTLAGIHHTMARYNILSGTLGYHIQAALEEHQQIIHFLERGQKDFAVVAIKNHIKSVGARIFEEEE